MEPKQLDTRIQECYDDLPPAERRLGDLLLNFPGDIANYSATELADLAKTSKAAATRFFRRLGYKDFNEARVQAREAQRWGSPLYQSNNNAKDAHHNRSQTISAHLEREAVNLQRTLEALSPDTLRAVAAELSQQRRIAIAGLRNSRFLAEYFHRQLSLLRPDVTLLPGAGQTLAEDLIDLGSKDLLVVLAMRRRMSQIRDLMQLARNNQIPCVLIADPSATELHELATWMLQCQVQSTSVFDSYTSVSSVLTLLINLTMREDLARSQQRLRQIESVHEELGELKVAGVHPPHPGRLFSAFDLSES
ncbi:RpiR family transcriptional regulator [Marinobacterium iners]|uniref:MurR/RpiR family transcriptional regulator n=1 Tax=Marinobacterium iners TaxID=48076 RepID=UPI001A8CEB62|nr:MurR/RpiR family transcriptional regulator [Marinobacterium iners]QSR36723.1 RpiR family transcriptional regulator [Marinobacterium iners]